MKTFNTNFATEKNKKTGASPLWILKCPFASGTLYLSDRAVTITGWDSGPTTKAWVARWGGIDEDMTDAMGSPQVSDFSLDLIIDPDEATDIHDLLWSEAVETLDCELYLWFEGLTASTDPPVLMWSGNIVDFERLNELLYSISLMDESVKLDRHPGRVLSLADYPNASLDDVGYQMPIVYGSVEQSKALRLDVGKKTALQNAITDTATSFYLLDGTGLSAGADIMIDGEVIRITTISGNQITACTRGYASTTKTAHTAGALVFEMKAACVFMFADHPVKAIGNIYAVRADGVPVDVTSICTKYTGRSGSELAGYEGRAVFTCSGFLTNADAVALGLVAAPIATTPGETRVERFCGGSPHTDSNSSKPSMTISSGSFPSGLGTIKDSWHEIGWHAGCTTPPTSGSFKQRLPFGSGGANIDIAEVTTSGLNLLAASPCIGVYPANWGGTKTDSHSGSASTGSWFITIDYIKMVRVYDLKTTVSTSAYESMIGGNLVVSGEGYQDDASGTFTGSASALIERPDHIVRHFLYAYAGVAVADFITDAATPFASDGYKFSMVLLERKRLRDWLAYMAFQCRCWFRFASGKAYLLYRPDSLTSGKTITAAMIRMNADFTTSVRISRSPLDEIVNKISLYYKRDWSAQAGREAYQDIVTVTDATSITAYGEKEKPDTFLFDFIRDATMAADVAAFYLARYKDRKKKVQLDLFLDNSEIEFAERLTITPLSSLLCEVRKVNFQPGSGVEKKNDLVTLVLREY